MATEKPANTTTVLNVAAQNSDLALEGDILLYQPEIAMKDGDLHHLTATTHSRPRNNLRTKLISGKTHATLTSQGQSLNRTLVRWSKIIDLQLLLQAYQSPKSETTTTPILQGLRVVMTQPPNVTVQSKLVSAADVDEMCISLCACVVFLSSPVVCKNKLTQEIMPKLIPANYYITLHLFS